MFCWRIARRLYADLSGSGGLKNSGRWHRTGHKVIYASSSIALAALEYAVHTAERPVDSVLLTMDLPADSVLKIEEYIGGPLPGNWPFVEAQTQHFGAEWLNSKESIALEVPSIVIPLERNLILNLAHPRFSEVKAVDIVPFFFDPRIFKTGRSRKS
jgi:RES domain-containing protein